MDIENYPVQFPGLGLSFPLHSIAFYIGSLPVRWYGIFIAVGLLLALYYAFRRCEMFHIRDDDLTDAVIISLIAGIVGARLYYVIFYDAQGGANPYFQDPLSIFRIWEGGLGIYGGIIASFVAAFIVCKKKKISTGALFDLAAPGFLIGQAIGRWGNFFNREAYGAATNAFWRMTGVNGDSMTTGYQPCFFFESVWCIIGFIILFNYSKRRRFNGEVFLMYVMWYGFGRFFIEGLRTDSLMLGNIKISQLVAVATFLVALCLIVYRRLKLREKVQDAAPYTSLFSEAAKAVDQLKQDDQDDQDDAQPEQTSGETPDGAEASGLDGQDETDADADDTTAPDADGKGETR